MLYVKIHGDDNQIIQMDSIIFLRISVKTNTQLIFKSVERNSKVPTDENNIINEPSIFGSIHEVPPSLNH